MTSDGQTAPQGMISTLPKFPGFGGRFILHEIRKDSSRDGLLPSSRNVIRVPFSF